MRRATDLSLRASKETARAIGWSMAALVATERHLWLTLSQINDKERDFLIKAPISPSGLFGDAVNTVVDSFQEAKKQVAGFCSDLSLDVLKVGLIGRIDSSHREVQKQSVATRAPPQRERGGECRSPLGKWRIWGQSFSIKSFGQKVLTLSAQDIWGQAPLGKSGTYLSIRCPSLLSALRGSFRYPRHPRCFRVQWSPASFSLSYRQET